MSEQTDKRNELISDWIDDRLNSQDSAEFDALMASSPEFASDAAVAKQISSRLGTFPKATLPSDFAKRVTSAAIAAKTELVEKSSLGNADYVMERSEGGKSDSRSGLTRNTYANNSKWAGLAAVAAGLLICVGLSMSALDSPLSKDMASNNSSPEVTDSDNTEISIRELAASDLVESTIAQQNSDVADSNSVPESATVPPSEIKITDEETLLAGNVNSDTKPDVLSNPIGPNANMIKESGNAAAEPAGIASIGGFAGLSEEEALAQLEQMMDGPTGFQMLMVVDISMTERLWNNDGLTALFDRYDIPMSDPTVLDASATDSLQDSRFVARNNENGERVSLVFVKADSSRLDQAIQEIYASYKDFPEISFDLAFDPPAQESLKQLKSIEFFSDEESEYGATPLMAEKLANPNGLVANFVAGNRPLNRESLANRLNGGKMESNGFDASMNPITYCLFVVRKSDGQTNP